MLNSNQTRKNFLINWIKRKERVISTPLNFPMLLALVVCFLSTINSINFLQNLKIFFLLGCGGGIFCLLWENLRGEKKLKLLLFFILLGAFYACIVAFYQYYKIEETYSPWGRRIWSVWNEPNDFGIYLTFLLPFFLSIALSKAEKWLRAISGIGFILGICALMLTYSRSCWIATVCAIFTLLVLKRKWLILGLVIVGLSVSLLHPSVYKRVSTIFDLTYVTNKTRLKVWSTGFEIVRNNPITGIGIGALEYAYKKYLPLEKHRSCTNLYLRIAVETGLPGLSIFFWAFGMVWRRTYKFLLTTKNNFLHSLASGMLATLVGIIVLGFFEG